MIGKALDAPAQVPQPQETEVDNQGLSINGDGFSEEESQVLTKRKWGCRSSPLP